MDAYEGYALKHGIRKPDAEPPTKSERNDLHLKIRENHRAKERKKEIEQWQTSKS